MNRKIFALITLLFSSSCVFDPINFLLTGNGKIQNDEPIALQAIKLPQDNKGNLISLIVKSNNYLKLAGDSTTGFINGVNLAITFSTPLKAPKTFQTIDNPEFQFLKDRRANGRFKINKSDIYLLHNNQEIHPKTISTGGIKSYQEYDLIESSSVAYSNYKRYGTKYLKFDLAPCTKLLDPGTKLVIKSIYKDDKVIKENIEFGFVKSSDNRRYSIWLE